MADIRLNIGKLCGVYALIHRGSNRMYIGSSKSIKHRIWAHIASLRRNAHSNPYLQAAFNKHGENAWFCEILEVCLEDELLSVEAKWITKKNACDKAFGFNLIRDPSRVRHAEETRRKMSNSSPLKGKPAYNRGQSPSEETRRKISEAGKGRIKTTEEREKLRNAMLSNAHPHRGKHLRLEVRQAMSRAKHLEPPKHGEFKGVSYDNRTKTFMARIYCQGKQIFLGRYANAEAAAQAYNNAAVQLYGAECYLNNVDAGIPARRTILGRKPQQCLMD